MAEPELVEPEEQLSSQAASASIIADAPESLRKVRRSYCFILLTTIKNQDEELEMKDKEIVRLQAKIEKIEKEAEKQHGEKPAKAAPAKKAAAKPAAKKASVKKAPAKKTTKVEPTEEKKD